MPVSPVVPSTIRVTFVVLQPNGDVCDNVLHFQFNGDHPAAGDLLALGTWIHTQWAGSIKTHMTVSASLRLIRLQDLTSFPYDTVEIAYNEAGTVGGDYLPAQLAVVERLYTLHAGRSGRGRIYFGSLPQTALTTGAVVNPIYTAAFDAYCNVLYGGHAVGALLYQLAVYSRKNGLSYQVRSATAQPTFFVQRRRANRRLI